MKNDFAYENEKTRAIAIKNKSKWVGPLKKTGLYLLLIAIAIFTVLPFIWTLSISLKGQNETVLSIPPQFIPKTPTLDNYKMVWSTLPIPKYLLNTLYLTLWGITLPIILSSLAAFPLARMEFKGRNFVFLAIVATMMIPGEVTMIPVYLIIQKLGLLGSYWGIIFPGAVSTMGIFLIRQAFMDIPREVEESAIIDGAGPFQIFWKILFPMVRPSLGVLTILSFVGSWNNFLWPLLVLNDPQKYPITLGLYQLQGAFSANTRLIAAGAMIALLPILVVFTFFQRYFIQSATSSAVKG